MPAAAARPELVCLGNLVVDDVVLPDGRTRLAQPGGATLYAALGAALFGARVAILAPVGDDYPAAALGALAARGVDLSRLRPLLRPGLRTWLLYEPGARRIVPRPGCPTHAEASPAPADLEGAFPDARAFHLAPAPLACQAALLPALAGRPGVIVSLDPHDRVTEESLGRWSPALALVDVFFVSAEEVDLDGLAAAPAAALARLGGGRLREVLLKQGARGGLLADLSRGTVCRWAPRAVEVVDPTGAGDAFAGAYLSGRCAGEEPERALERGVVAASFALAGWGPDGLLAATPDAARARRRAWFGG
ncbi:MAG TPA: PfkB family carbohydrate kinase [Polyangia bacterium]|jgi:ribokinase